MISREALTVGLVIFLMANPRALAHDHWINAGDYKNAEGTRCCGQGDCVIVLESNVRVSPAGYTLSSGEVIPYSEAQPSEDTHYWRCHKADGTRRCFFAPQPGS